MRALGNRYTKLYVKLKKGLEQSCDESIPIQRALVVVYQVLLGLLHSLNFLANQLLIINPD